MAIDIYQRIQKLAKLRGTSIYRIEHDAGLANGIIYKWKNSNPNFDSITKVANALGVSIEYFTKGDE
ncbi:helix-turn-helix domain-containing protein [Levilactobacillus acidifarinae]|uniref:HTH cro/C1-type domain-containing protein n=1 Tax=Levilactobacillus acidifarinae DSM 19394 = JCM 15949 TaxID=1423715 RepID=A0A0R1LNE8_9LACO|nr:helix-turn-helix domain-containing protein [Levilactobacillus acidifarinae]KRK94217.1 hypothetical protein FD25_GL000167 [Levilactobacillus acidifarinae DSM 19394]GEO70492.1 hypothetical protein LAC03_24020 [Levilactobacillus acidifarinae]